MSLFKAKLANLKDRHQEQLTKKPETILEKVGKKLEGKKK